MEKLPISLVVITLNEEPNIERCLRSVPWASEVIVLDSGSQDGTVALARSLGAQCFTEDFRGFREQKQRVTDLAANNWILSLDADEALSPALSQEILSRFGKEAGASAFRMPRLSFHMGRWIRYGGWYPDWQLRLFDRRRSRWVGGHVHEKVMCEVQPLDLQHPIEHRVFRSISHQVSTNNEYSSKGARDLFEKGERFSIFRMLLKAKSKFFETYILKRGFFDGLPGFFISVSAAYSVFMKYAKLWELENKLGDK